MNPVADTWI